MYCLNCGKSLSDEFLFCDNCGARLEKETIMEPEQPAGSAPVTPAEIPQEAGCEGPTDDVKLYLRFSKWSHSHLSIPNRLIRILRKLMGKKPAKLCLP